MYDTVGMFLENYYLNESLVSNLRESSNEETGEIVVKGNIENLRVKGIDNRLTVIGSLPKFYFGNNLHQLTRKETELSIEKLSDILQSPLKESKVFRLDIGANFILNEPLQNYFSCLGNLSRFKKSEIANKQSLYYTTSKKTLAFYDKLKEMKRTRQNIPEDFLSRIILRYELRLTKKVAESLRLPEVRAEDLYEEKFFIKAIDYWKDFYFLIQRVNRLKFNQNFLPSLNRKVLLSGLAAMQVRAIGYSEIISMIESEKSKIKHREQYQRIKKLIRDLLNSPDLTEQSEAIIELDSKVIRAVEEIEDE